MFPVHMCWELELAYISLHILDQLELFRQEWCFPCAHALEASTYINNLNFSGRSDMFPVFMFGVRASLLIPLCKSLLPPVCDEDVAESNMEYQHRLTPWTFQVGVVCSLCTCAWNWRQPLLANTYSIKLNFSDRSGVFPKHMHWKPETAYDSQHIF
jgi:hypothetical protein